MASQSMTSRQRRGSKIESSSTKSARQRLLDGFRQVFPRFQRTKTLKLESTQFVVSIVDVSHVAFGAYNDPSETGFLERTSQEHDIQYLNANVMDNAVAGVLKIHLRSAHNLWNADGFGGESDPYVVFSYGTSVEKSEFVEDDRNPVWNSTHYLIIRDEQVKKGFDEKLDIKVFDDDSDSTLWNLFGRVKSDDLLGKTSIDIQKLRQEPGIHDYDDIELSDTSGRARGTMTISFSAEFMSFKEAFVDRDAKEEGPNWAQREDSKNEPLTAWPSGLSSTQLCRTPMDPLAFITAPSTDTQAWVSIERSVRKLFISFRGTEEKFQDIVQDLKAWPVGIGQMGYGNYILQMTPELRDVQIRVHRGFLEAYETVREALLQLVYDVTGWNKEWEVCATGHSLGGALATLCAFELANRKNPDGSGPTVRMVNFGAPRVGNTAFVDAYNRTVPTSYRVVEADDPITFLPPRYAHVDQKVIIKESGDFVAPPPKTPLRRFRKAVNREIKTRSLPDEAGFSTVLRKYRTQISALAEKHYAKNYYSILQKAADKFFALRSVSIEE